MTHRQEYIDWCGSQSTLPLFFNHWWLDAVSGGEWDVAITKKGGKIIGVWPFVLKKRWGFTVLSQPVLTPFLGPWFDFDHLSTAKKLSREYEVLELLLGELPSFDYFRQSFHISKTSWLPLHWKGFHLTSKVTYRLEEIQDIEKVWSALSESCRRQIRKAENRFELIARNDLNVEDFIQMNKSVFRRQHMALPYREDVVRKIDASTTERSASTILSCVDEAGLTHAAVYIVWDNDTSYYLMGGVNPQVRSSGAMSLCLWEAIKQTSLAGRVFDFEGSMIEPIEKFFRGFGAAPTNCNVLTKIKSRPLKLALSMRTAMS